MKIPRQRIFNNIRTSHVAKQSMIVPGMYSIYSNKDTTKPFITNFPASMVHPPSADWDEVLPEDNGEKIFFENKRIIHSIGEGDKIEYMRPESFKAPKDGTTYKILAFEGVINKEGEFETNILSVLRNSDNNVFSVDNLIGNPYAEGWQMIKSIQQPNNDFQIILYTTDWATLLHDAVQYRPILTTNDGTTVFENDTVNCINANDPTYSIYDHTIDPKVDPRSGRIYFATIANAEKYQEDNIQKISINDLLSIMKDSFVNESMYTRDYVIYHVKNLIRKRLNRNISNSGTFV